MKKILFVSFLVISFSGFGQSGGWSNFGAWTQNTCFPGIKHRIKIAHNINNKTSVEVEFQNNYNKGVSFAFRAFASQSEIAPAMLNESSGGSQSNVNLSPRSGSGGTYNSQANGHVNTVYIAIYKMEFDGRSNGEKFAPCDSGNPCPFCNAHPESSLCPNYDKTAVRGGGSKSSTNSVINANNQNSGNSINDQISALTDERLALCRELAAIGNTEACTNENLNRLHFDRINGSENERELKSKNYLNVLEQDVARLKKLLDKPRSSQVADGKSAEENRLKKEAEEKAGRYNGYMQKGNNALSNGKYDEAAGHYNNAFKEANTEAESQQAVDGINRANKAKADEARKVRIEERQKQEAATNAATGAALSAVGALMALMNDSYTQKPFAARYYLGFGMENLILNINDFTNKQSDIKSSLPLVFMGGLNFTLFNNKNVNWVINPYFRYNQIFVSTGEAGSGYGAGINTHLSFGFRKDSPIRFFGEYQYNINTLETSYDTDVASGGTTATDAVYEGYYETLSKRIGGGLILRFINGDRETFIKPGYFIDNIALLGIKRNYASLDMYFANTIGIELAYSKNYVSLGDVDFPNSSKMKSAIKDPIATDYWTVKFYRRGLFGKK